MDVETVGVLLGDGTKSSAGSLEGPAADLPAASTLPIVWYEEARRLIGTREVKGSPSNPKISAMGGKARHPLQR